MCSWADCKFSPEIPDDIVRQTTAARTTALLDPNSCGIGDGFGVGMRYCTTRVRLHIPAELSNGTSQVGGRNSDHVTNYR